MSALSPNQRAALAEVLGSITLTPGIWLADLHMDKIADVLESFTEARAGDPIYRAAAILAEHFPCWSPLTRGWVCQSGACGFELRTAEHHNQHVARVLFDAGLFGGVA